MRALWLHKLPDLLVLHLKRFKFMGMFGRKIDTRVSFPMDLDLSRYTRPTSGADALYDLTGVVVHHGYSLSSGHYLSYVKSSDGLWYQKNDSLVGHGNVRYARSVHVIIVDICGRSGVQFADQPLEPAHRPSTGSVHGVCLCLCVPRLVSTLRRGRVTLGQRRSFD